MTRFTHIAYRSPKRRNNCQEIKLQGIREPRCPEPKCEKLLALATRRVVLSMRKMAVNKSGPRCFPFRYCRQIAYDSVLLYNQKGLLKVVESNQEQQLLAAGAARRDVFKTRMITIF